MNEYLIMYDICSPRRLQRMHRRLKRVAVPIQYSLFFLRLDPRQLEPLLTELVALINPRTDDLRCYPLPKRGMRLRLGKPVLPEGIVWSDLPAPWWGDISNLQEDSCHGTTLTIENKGEK